MDQVERMCDRILRINDYGKYAELSLEEDTDPQEIHKKLVESVAVRRFELKAPSSTEIFIEVVENA